MNDLDQRLITCFTAVFPDLSPDQIRAATQDTVAAWDSVAYINLMSLIESEFGLVLEYEEIEKLSSFAQIAQRLAQPA
jgi:acyl carrier protein